MLLSVGGNKENSGVSELHLYVFSWIHFLDSWSVLDYAEEGKGLFWIESTVVNVWLQTNIKSL